YTNILIIDRLMLNFIEFVYFKNV
ncbi:hypothetical protein EHRUM4_06610, partial [Ehrlichia ruminantium]